MPSQTAHLATGLVTFTSVLSGPDLSTATLTAGTSTFVLLFCCSLLLVTSTLVKGAETTVRLPASVGRHMHACAGHGGGWVGD